MTDDFWWKEKLMEEYIHYENEINENSMKEVKELILCDDGVYRVKE
ncbi:hypothetical protein [Siminovitchia fordii]|uniref:Uncharacterized protein n=1 Tax=Siminovitchia fordii TaxID=254759 RepID=A0ABQ4KA57_9BACI|nr:hypothetical protein [Siminovitchia fordii]GIN22609.1 hypothetical protein J1TS3_37430 [Siminovitchia fordii]